MTLHLRKILQLACQKDIPRSVSDSKSLVLLLLYRAHVASTYSNHSIGLIYSSEIDFYGVEWFDDVSWCRGRDQGKCVQKHTKFVVRARKDVQNLSCVSKRYIGTHN